MNIGYNNGKATYNMGGKSLEEVTEERDLGVILKNDLTCKKCNKAVKSANRALGMITGLDG
jgi:hypothetical protein